MFGKKKEKTFNGIMIDGLPTQQNAELLVKLTDSGLTFTVPSLKQTFDLSAEKINSVKYYNETEMEKIVSQSAPGMLIGAAAFGVIGAMVGGRVKTKEKRNVHHFMVVYYEDKKIVLESKDFFGVGQVVDQYNKWHPESNQPITITL